MPWETKFVDWAAMNCIFCQIVDRKRPARIYAEDELLIVFEDIMPKASVHLLVCPKKHYPNLQDIPNELLILLFGKIKAIAKELGIEDNYRLLLNNGARSGQIVGHLHFHFLSNAEGVRPAFRTQSI